MPVFLRRLLAVHYPYQNPLQAMRARIFLPFSLVAGGFLILINLLTVLNAIAQRSEQIQGYSLIILPAAWVIMLLTASLIQRGWINTSMALLGALVLAYNLADVFLSGSMTTGIIFSLVVIFFSLSFGSRGAAAAYLYSVVMLAVMARVRSDGLWGTDEIDNIASIVFYSGANLTITTILLWLFAGQLQQAFRQSSRLVAQTRATATVGQALSRVLNLDELLTEAVDLIRDRFALYHVQVYLVDAARNYANLAASTGTIGEALLAQGFHVAVGPRAVAGQVIETGEQVYVEDITQTAYYHPDMLAHSRSELGLPLRVGDDLLGVLDVHSSRPGAFGPDDIETMHILANQLSQSIYNARLFEAQQQNVFQNRRLFLESETNLREIERLNRQLIGQSWQDYVVERDPALFNVQITGGDLNPGAADWTPSMRLAAERRRIVSQKSGSDQVLAVPIVIRGQAIGAIEVRLPEQQNPIEVRNIVQAVAERVAVSLENIRLFEQARIAVEREQQINRISARLQGLTSIDDVLATALETLGLALGAEQGTIRLATGNLMAADDEPAFAPDTGIIPSPHRSTSEPPLPPSSEQTGSPA